MKSFKQTHHSSGVASIFVLVLGITATFLIGGLVGNEYTAGRRRAGMETTLTIAEAGVQYYRWHLAHNPTDFQDGTGQPGPYVHEFKDPQGAVVGQYSLEVIPPERGYTNVTIVSTGSTVAYPEIKRTVRAQYGLPSLARYSFLHNANVWFGQGLTVHGRALSNGGIRQDGVNDSLIMSAKENYTCGSETGCSPSQTKDGVWGGGGPDALWEFPVLPEDFDAISVDFVTMRNAAQQDNSYFGVTSSPGYRIIFQADGTARVYRVTSTGYYRGYDSDTGCSNLYQRISNQSFIGTYSLSTHPVFFFEDQVWVEGVVNGKATVVAARFPINSYNEDIWINNNLTYLAKDGKNHLGVIAQRNIYFVKDLPNDFEINAALLAQQGKIIRHHYAYCTYYSNAVRDHLEIYGSVISNQKSYWNWGSGPSSGFDTRDVYFDSTAALSPPPFFPASGDYEFISWEENVE
jgi:hypothetical protein